MKKISVFLIGVSFGVTAYFYRALPKVMPIHWNFQGNIDNYMNKNIAAWLIPCISLLMFLGFQLLPHLDPKKLNYKTFQKEWEWIQFGLIVFFVFLQGVIVASSLGAAVDVRRLVVGGVGVLFMTIGFQLPKIKQNFFIGIRTPWTISDTKNWEKTHAYGARVFIIVGLCMMVDVFIPWQFYGMLFGAIILAAVLPIVYSFLLFKKREGYMKYVHIVAAVIVLSLIFMRGVTGEDTWICEGDHWVAHGHPSVPMPKIPCAVL